jgi:hypothetical protein
MSWLMRLKKWQQFDNMAKLGFNQLFFIFL